MGHFTLGLGEKLQQYLLDHSLREPEICRRLRDHTLAMPNAAMLSSPEQVQLLALLCGMLGARRGLEIGTFTGYTTLRLTLALPELQMICCDVSEEYTSVGRAHWQEAGVADRVDLRLAPAGDTLDRLLAEGARDSFDFAYIDADKTGYRGYIERALQLVRPGGLIAVDNTLWGGAVADPAEQDEDTVALRELNRWLHGLEACDLSMVPVGDGLTLLRRR